MKWLENTLKYSCVQMKKYWNGCLILMWLRLLNLSQKSETGGKVDYVISSYSDFSSTASDL